FHHNFLLPSLLLKTRVLRTFLVGKRSKSANPRFSLSLSKEIEKPWHGSSGRTKEKRGSKTMSLRREPEEDAPEFQKESMELLARGEGEEEVGVGEGGVVEGEVGRGVVSDEDGFGSEERRETARSVGR
ncbi:hypothetical protein VIGAN_05093400, partial [Vigna angularis var. angularis]